MTNVSACGEERAPAVAKSCVANVAWPFDSSAAPNAHPAFWVGTQSAKLALPVLDVRLVARAFLVSQETLALSWRNFETKVRSFNSSRVNHP